MKPIELMNRSRFVIQCFAVVALAAGAAQTTHAFTWPVTVTSPATRSSEVRVGGVQTAQRFFNIRGDANQDAPPGTASFGVLDFQFSPRLGAPSDLTDITSARLNMFESRFAGTAHTGTFDILLTDNHTIDITDAGPLRFSRTSLPRGIDTAVFTGNFWKIGEYVFEGGTSAAGNRHVSYSLNPTGAAETYLLGRLNTGGNFRLVLVPQTSGTEDSGFRGALHENVSERPSLTIEAVPEPATILALGAGVAALVARRRRR